MSANTLDLKDWVKRAQAGEALAYRNFLEEISRRLRPRLNAVLPKDRVDDALQETLLAVHRAFPTLDPERSVMAWVMAIAAYKSSDQLRSLYKNATVDWNEAISNSKEGLAVSGIDVDAWIDLKRLLHKLSDRERSVLIQLKQEELSVSEIAQKYGLSESNVKVIAFRAIKKLRQMSVEEFYE